MSFDWKTVKLAEICEIVLGQSPESSTYNSEGIGLPFFQGKAEFGPVYPSVLKWCSSPKKIARKNDVLISVRAPVGPTNLAPTECCIGRGLAAIRPSKDSDYRYVLHFLRSIERELSEMGTGTTFKAISGDVLRSIEIPLAPLNEQRVIVAEIEKQFSRLDEAVAGLKRIKANLKRYKAAVLKAAVEGKLTEEWRKAHPNVESGAVLLRRILTERKKKWEEKNPGKKYKEPASPDTANLPELLKGWVWATIEQLSVLVTDGDHNPPKRVKIGVPHLTAKNVVNGRLNEKECTYVQKIDFEKVKQRYEPQSEDVIITCVGTIGRTAIVPAGYLFSADRNLAAIRLVKNGMAPRMLQVNFDAPAAQEKIQGASGSTAQPHFYLGDLRSFTVRLMPYVEQLVILSEVERCLSVAEEIEAIIETNLKRADRLRQGILKKAFSGNLITGGQYTKSG